ncbi:MAG TPA: ABC transporter ATP-binding protein [Eubacteriaceae bacterium]|jgi:NitT/TauT family transport system ATP-binding protein|nr:ABC transporter ATP-binding protein [Eubacteriaceae bacterium]
MTTPIVKINNLSKIFHSPKEETLAVKDFSLEVRAGEFVVLVGPSGCGKSTILSALAGLIKPSAGEIIYNPNKAIKKKPSIGYMLQQDHLFQWRTILQNAILGLEIQNKNTKENILKTRKLLEVYGLGDFINHYPNQLSGGMRQRAALIRTLAVDPEILLLDEPFSALDYQTRLAVADDIGSIIKNEKRTAVMVTHDISEAISMADRVVVLSKRPGMVKKIHEIKLSCSKQTPIIRREAPEFREYFNEIWKELDVHVS